MIKSEKLFSKNSRKGKNLKIFLMTLLAAVLLLNFPENGLLSRAISETGGVLRDTPATSGEPMLVRSTPQEKVIRFHANGGEFTDGTNIQIQEINEQVGYDYPHFYGMNQKMKTIKGRIYRPAPGYEVDEGSGLARSGFVLVGWATTADGTEDVSRVLWNQKITDTTDFYAIWHPVYVNNFYGNGGIWHYKSSPDATDEQLNDKLSGAIPAGRTQQAFADVMDASQDGAYSRGINRLAPPNGAVKFKGWYTSADEISPAYDFTVPTTEPRNAYAHWTAGLRIDVLGADDRNTVDYTVEVTNAKDQSPLTGGFTGSAAGKPNVQWQSESHDLYMGDELTIKFTKLPVGKKAEIISVPSLEQIASVKPVAGQANSFTVSMRTMPHKSNQEAYYARFRLVPETYKVNFVAGQNGTVAAQDVLSVEYQQTLAQVPAVTAKTGYKFAGWQKDGATGKLYTNAEVQALPITADTVFTATFVKDICQIRYDANGGRFADNTAKRVVEVQVGTTISIMDAPTRKGYKFLYWKGSRYNPGDNYQVQGDHLFTAIWEKVKQPEITAATGKNGSAGTTTSQTKRTLPKTGETPTITLTATFAGAAVLLTLWKKRRVEQD